MAELARQASCDDLAPAQAWVDLAATVGATPAEGPLRFDLLPPTPSQPRRWGLSVFDDRVIDVARTWAATWLGPAASHALAPLAAPGARWVGGLVWRGGAWGLKLYAVAGFADLTDVPTGAIAVGVDVDGGGIARWRSYHPAGPGLLDGTPARPWHAGHAGVEHHLVTVAGDGSKRSQNWIFGPRASWDDLRSLADRLTLTDVERWCAAAVDLPTDGLRLAPAALEWDMHADGRVEPDVLFTLSEPA